MTEILHLIGPGGAGKTVVGPMVARRLGWRFEDLDACFMSSHGQIDSCIESFGYHGYAQRNFTVYCAIKAAAREPLVIALSSGFMLYPHDVDARYSAVCRSIEADALTALLLPSFDLEACVRSVVQRQLARPYLRGDALSEERRIRERFPLFDALSCRRFRSDCRPDLLAAQIERAFRTRADAGAVRTLR